MKSTATAHDKLYGIIVLALLTVLVAGSASAAIIKHFEFNADGVLPSDDPDIAYHAPSGDTEADIFSVSGGIMAGNHVPGGSQPIRYAFPGEYLGLYPANGGISPTEPWSVEIRARVLYNDGGGYLNLGSFMMWNSNRRFNIYFMNPGVRVDRSHAVSHLDYACDMSQWHVLKMWSENGSNFSASVDGVVFADTQAGVNDSNSLNGFYLSLNPHAHGAHVEWDYVRFESGENAVPVEGVSFGGIKALYR